jgi:hypothetical protein
MMAATSYVEALGELGFSDESILDTEVPGYQTRITWRELLLNHRFVSMVRMLDGLKQGSEWGESIGIAMAESAHAQGPEARGRCVVELKARQDGFAAVVREIEQERDRLRLAGESARQEVK